MNWGHYLFGFSGRINRAKYWLWVLLYVIAAIAVTVIAYAITIYATNGDPLAGNIVQFVFFIAALISSLAVVAKRLHDRNKSAWWILLFVVAPSVLVGIGAGTTFYAAITGAIGNDIGGDIGGMGLVGIACTLAAIAISIWAFIELACLRGTVGPNQYGPDPLEGKF